MKFKLTVLLIALASIINAQDNYMSLSFGGSMPLGDYAATGELLETGYAQTGFMANYNGVYFLSDYFALQGNVKFCSNILDKQKAGDQLKEILPPDFPADSISQFGVSDKWNLVGFMVGPQVSLPLGKISIDAYALAGLGIIIAPTMEITARVNNQWNSQRFTTQTASFAFGGGLSLRYKLNDEYGLILFGDYMQSSAKRTGFIQEDGGDFVETTYTMPVKATNIGIGIVYRM